MVEAKEFEAAAERDAVRTAARELGIKEGDLEYRVIEEGSKGFFGVGGRPTRIVVTLPEPQTAGPSIEEVIRGFQKKMTDAMKMELDIEAESREDMVYLCMDGPDKDMLLESRAELLEAFQYLLNRIFRKRLDGKRLLADCDGYREKKDEELKQMAKRMSHKVKKTGIEEQLGVMNPYERRIVHLTVAAEEGVSSASRGEGFMKRVTIMPV